MDTEKITNLVDLLSKTGITIAGIIAALIALFAWYRTRSTHMLLTRLWVIFNGKKECKIASINDFLDTQSAVLQFRFMTGIHARTLVHANKLISWSKKHDEDIADIAACGQYFDIEKVTIQSEDKLPGNWAIGMVAVITFLLGLATPLSAGSMLFNRAVLKMKDSGTVFTMTEKIAKPFNSSPAIQLAECPSLMKNRPHPGFANSDIVHICDWAENQETKKDLADKLKEQREALLILAIFLGFLFIPSYQSIKSMVAARTLGKRLKQRRHGTR